jgi:phosphosulfolactate synthase (CoM biosynthesis protein A)
MIAVKTKKKVCFKELVLENDYENFPHFYEENKDLIYRTIVETFNGFLDLKRKKKLNLVVYAKIQGFEWDTEFIFERNDHEILMRDLMPHFEKIEDYEFCDKIVKIKNLLTNKK